MGEVKLVASILAVGICVYRKASGVTPDPLLRPVDTWERAFQRRQQVQMPTG